MSEGTKGYVVLADGTAFQGIVATKTPNEPSVLAVGEVVFNTAMTGYQEVITDPSYSGQMVTFTYPHIGNYGVTDRDNESGSIHAEAVVVRDVSTTYSNWRGQSSLIDLLNAESVPLITDVDTRALTRHIRAHGSLGAVLVSKEVELGFTELSRALTTEGRDLVTGVTTNEILEFGSEGPLVVAYDFGVKRSMVHLLAKRFRVLVVPAYTKAHEVMDLKPDGVFLSNGPGDPAALDDIASEIRELMGQSPMFGICLGHQIMALAQGARTTRMRFGHHGANHPLSSARSIEAGDVPRTRAGSISAANRRGV